MSINPIIFIINTTIEKINVNDETIIVSIKYLFLSLIILVPFIFFKTPFSHKSTNIAKLLIENPHKTVLTVITPTIIFVSPMLTSIPFFLKIK